MVRRHTCRTSSLRLGALATAGAALALLVGCGDDRKLADVVERAGAELSAASGNGVSMPPVDVRTRTYDSVLSTLRQALQNNEEAPGAAAAKLLMAQAMHGQGDVAAERAGEARRQLTYAITKTRSKLDLHASRESQGAALRVYDPGDDLSQLDQAQRDIEQTLASRRAALADKQARIQQLRSQMEEQRHQAEQRIAEAARIREQATDASPIQRARLIRQANDIERIADQHEKRRAQLLLLVESLESESDEVRIHIASAQRREELVREARDRIESSADLLEAESARAMTDARTIASELGNAFDALMERLDQQVTPPFEQAASKYASASSQARQARNEVGTSAPAVAAMALHASANLHRAQGELLESIESLARKLGEELGAARFTESADQLAQRRDQTYESAADLYEQAGSTYQSLRLGGGQSLSGLSDRLQAFAQNLRGQPIEERPPARQETEPAPDGAQDFEPGSGGS